jgi:superfamily I DNA and RNA helicase
VSLEIVYGEGRHRETASQLADVLSDALETGTIYLGYPVLTTSEQKVNVDALLVSPDHGLVAFLIADFVPVDENDWARLVDEQDRLYAVLDSNLGRHDALRYGRSLAVEPQTATIVAALQPPPSTSEDGFFGGLEAVADWIASLPPLPEGILEPLQAALQRVTNIKPRKRRASVQNEASRGGRLKEIEKGIANLDRFQKRAAIESPEGPQRIRGLAGSGKTVVLSLKAAYWHTQHPEWNIALTFHSRALYQQIEDLVTRFTFEHSNDRPDYSRLHIVHSWGSSARPGVYSMIAQALGETPRDWAYASGKYGRDDAFRAICQELLSAARERRVEPLFDAVLIDEAQDLPPEFFQLVYEFTKSPKRIVWGYDELQKLSEAAMPDTDELFGTNADGSSKVTLRTAPGGPRRDIVLPVCYRNTPWALATAHAIGLGVYRQRGLLQHPDEPKLWEDIGYEVVDGELVAGEAVTLRRSATSYPAYFPELLDRADAVVTASFDDARAQDAWVAEQISLNLSQDELDPDDILIVLPDPVTARKRARSIAFELSRLNISSHLVGVNTSQDEIFDPSSVAMAHIFRAKGNEAPMVYVLDAHDAAQPFNEVTRRNTLFTGITRSRAWVRVCGWGSDMVKIQREIEQVATRNYELNFKIPTYDELARLRHIHRERPAEQEASVRRATEALSSFLRAFERGEIDLEDLPEALRIQLSQLGEVADGGDT